MDRFLVVNSVIIYVENRIQTDINYTELEKITGFSLAHIRDIFVSITGKSLSKYILERRICNIAFEIVHSNGESLSSIASKYGVTNADTFTRAFKRVTGFTPSEFKKNSIPVERIKLCSGVYGVGFSKVKKEKDINE